MFVGDDMNFNKQLEKWNLLCSVFSYMGGGWRIGSKKKLVFHDPNANSTVLIYNQCMEF